MKGGTSAQELNVNNIDKPIRKFILYLNSIEGVETIGSCSGHPQDGRARCYVYFKPNNNKNLEKVLNFFRKFGFSVKLHSLGDCWDVDLILEKSSGDITKEDIELFWKRVGGEFIEKIF